MHERSSVVIRCPTPLTYQHTGRSKTLPNFSSYRDFAPSANAHRQLPNTPDYRHITAPLPGQAMWLNSSQCRSGRSSSGTTVRHTRARAGIATSIARCMNGYDGGNRLADPLRISTYVPEHDSPAPVHSQRVRHQPGGSMADIERTWRTGSGQAYE